MSAALAWILSTLRKHWLHIVLIAVAVIGAKIFYGCGRDSRADEVAELTTKLVSSERTVEIEKGLFAIKTVEVEDLKDLLSKLGEENEELAATVRKGQMEVIALNELVIKWRRAYEAAVKATQTEEPPVDPGGPPRKRVEFAGAVGPIHVEGHTMTDPPEAYLRWHQVDPLRITVAITKNRDGTYSTIVGTSDDAIEVDIRNAVLDLSSLRPRWYQRLWAEAGVDLVGDRSVRAGLSYRWDRWSVGASCQTSADTSGCGASLGFRIFK